MIINFCSIFKVNLSPIFLFDFWIIQISKIHCIFYLKYIQNKYYLLYIFYKFNRNLINIKFSYKFSLFYLSFSNSPYIYLLNKHRTTYEYSMHYLYAFALFSFPFISFYDLHLSFHKNRHIQQSFSFIRIKHFSTRKLYNFRNRWSIWTWPWRVRRKTPIAQHLFYYIYNARKIERKRKKEKRVR